MLLERTLSQLNIIDTTPERALVLGHLGYVQWLGALPAMSDYRQQAEYALAKAKSLRSAAPAIGVFCDLLIASMRSPVAPIPLELPERQRRGGSKARRAAI
ncbi:MAG: hypothetical protein AAF666_13765 [Pseudomonadota bacterium]